MRIEASYPFLGGLPGTERTVTEMNRLVREGRNHPAIVHDARQIVRNVPRKDYAAEAEAIFAWIKDNIRYTRDPRGTEWLQRAEVTLKEGHGDCDCLSVLQNAMFEALGMETGFVAVKAEPRAPEEFSHIYPIVNTQHGWRAADVVANESYFGWQPSSGTWGRKVFLNR